MAEQVFSSARSNALGAAVLLAAAGIAAIDGPARVIPGTALAVNGPQVAVIMGGAVLAVLYCQWVMADRRPRAEGQGRIANLGRLILHLWPVIVLTAVYPLVSPRMAGHDVAGVPLTSFILMVAVTVPWISQATCAPLYRMLQPIWESGGRSELRREFWRFWPASFALAVPLTAVFALLLRLGLRWSPRAIAAYLLLLLLNVVFAQCLVVTNIAHARVAWAVGWTAYSLPVVVAPTAWVLPPLCGIGVLVVSWVRVSLVRPGRLPLRPAALDLIGGLLLGSVLWADKFFYFLRGDGDIEVRTLFVSLLPAVVAYNYYFVCLEPQMGQSSRAVRTALEGAPLRWLSPECSSMGRFVSRSLANTALVGAGITLVLTLAVARTDMDQLQVAVISTASWLMMMCTITCYKIDYAGARTAPRSLSAVYLAVCVVAFAWAPTGVRAYVWLGVAAAGVLGTALVQCARLWRQPQYSLFWKHAVRW